MNDRQPWLFTRAQGGHCQVSAGHRKTTDSYVELSTRLRRAYAEHSQMPTVPRKSPFPGQPAGFHGTRHSGQLVTMLCDSCLWRTLLLTLQINCGCSQDCCLCICQKRAFPLALWKEARLTQYHSYLQTDWGERVSGTHHSRTLHSCETLLCKAI